MARRTKPDPFWPTSLVHWLALLMLAGVVGLLLLPPVVSGPHRRRTAPQPKADKVAESLSEPEVPPESVEDGRDANK